MRRSLGTYLTAAVIVFGVFTCSTASAALLAGDSASDPAYNDGWQSGDNGGSGWGGGWTFRNGGNVVQNNPGGSFFGAFVGSSLANNNPGGSDSNGDGDINTAGNKAWGMYANTSNEIYAVRPLSGSLSVGQSIWFEFDNGNVDSTRVLGVRLLANASDISTRQAEVRFVGGDSFYTVFATPNTTSTLGFSREGISVEFTLTSATTFSMDITRLQSGQSQVINGSLIAPGGNLNINAIAFRNLAAGSGATNDGFFNSIAVVPEPGMLGVFSAALAPLVLKRRRQSSV
jgi:hypothetical protein